MCMCAGVCVPHTTSASLAHRPLSCGPQVPYVVIMTIILILMVIFHSVSGHRGGPQVLEKKGIVTGAELRRAVEVMDARGTMNSGAKLVARAWVDPEFKTRLLADAAAAAKELGIETSNWTAPAKPGETLCCCMSVCLSMCLSVYLSVCLLPRILGSRLVRC
jgi:hypothetical protein